MSVEFRVKHLSREVSGVNFMSEVSLISCIKNKVSQLHVIEINTTESVLKQQLDKFICISCKIFKNYGLVYPPRLSLFLGLT